MVTRRGKLVAVLVGFEGSDREDVMSIASSPSAMERDLRLDFFRGLALFCIFIDHLPDNILREFTLQSVMFSDAAEVFISRIDAPQRPPHPGTRASSRGP